MSTSQKGFSTVIIILLVLVIAAIGGGAYYLGTQKNTKSNPPSLVTSTLQPSASPILSPSVSPNQNIVDTSNWQIYTDNKYFSIKYPGNWVLKTNFDIQGDVMIYNPKNMQSSTTNGGGQVEFPKEYVEIISVQPSTKNAYQTVDEYKQQWKAKNVDIKSEDASGNGLDLVLYDNQGEGSRGRNIAISNGTLLGNLNASIENLSDKKIENYVLGTFKFLKQ